MATVVDVKCFQIGKKSLASLEEYLGSIQVNGAYRKRNHSLRTGIYSQCNDLTHPDSRDFSQANASELDCRLQLQS